MNHLEKAKEALETVKTAIDAVSFNHQHADIIITMLEAGAAVEQTIQAILPALKKDSILIDMSSTQQGEAQRFFQWLSPLGVHFIDAPVSGGVIGAEAGTLAIMAGAEAAAYAQAESVLKVLGNPLRVGEPGTGQLAKLCNQLIVGGTINIIAEALLFLALTTSSALLTQNFCKNAFFSVLVLEANPDKFNNTATSSISVSDNLEIYTIASSK
jgi:2-hydroxy-3-oxopropionate reductase